MLRRKGFRRSFTKMMAACVAAFTVLTVFPVSAMAAMHNVSYITIGDGETVADTMTVNGVTVQALYHPKTDAYSYDRDPTYCCAGLVSRFYRSVYGRTVNNLCRTDSIPNIDRGSFSYTRTPKVGDIIRDNVSVHWAIVKAVNGSEITMFQQNAWNPKDLVRGAMTHAVTYVNDSRYSFFTWNGNTNPSAGVSLNLRISADTVTASNAVIRAAIDNPGYVTVNQVGCNLWRADGTQLSHHTETCSRNENPFNVYYDINKELGVTLQAGQTYQYQLFAVYGGKEYDSAKASFTTNAAPASPSVSPSVSPAPSASKSAGAKAGQTMLLMKKMLGAKKTAVKKTFGSPKKASASSMTFSTGKEKFGSKGTLTVKLKSSKVKSITWKLSYSGKNAVKSCRNFYKALVAGGSSAFGSSGTGRTSGYTQYTTWAGHVEAKCIAGGSAPCIIITAK